MLLLTLLACATDKDTATDTDSEYWSTTYAADEMWLCRPGLEQDWCQSDLTATEVLPDNTTAEVPFERTSDAAFDCFYVYPTVDLFGDDLYDEFDDVSLYLDPLLAQAAWLTGTCDVHAPLYRQVGLAATGDERDVLLETAYADVLDAFQHFLANRSQGRPFALVGHSQGSQLLGQLLDEVVEEDPELADRLVVAALIGYNFYVPEGEVVGGSFDTTPVCETPGQTGCVMTWVTYASDATPGGDDRFGLNPAGQTTICTDPQLLAGTSGRLGGSVFPTFAANPLYLESDSPVSAYDTPFVLYRDLLRGQCVTRDGYTYYEITVDPIEGDQREQPPLRNSVVEAFGFGLHLLDWNLPMAEILTSMEARQP